ncbi:hypothetical protein CPB84DRAFT_1957521 [Gymnopilus junonius]|uniref:Thioredoxin domain-containing protein n=1 Tax=Gymnopilus junonius TaxID=109634 RepID=A0A9P5TTW2_GYMJU|nr:hypothetical protein CPB84DRAFT_1957521 [Gymnopilus junonius]
MSITHLTSLSHLNGILSKSKDKLSVWALSCNCAYLRVAVQTVSNVNFLKCDVDAVPDVARSYAVTAMPTFVFLKGSAKVDQVRGADRSALANTVKKHATISGGSPSSFTGKGHTLGGGPAPPDVAGEIKQSMDKVAGGFNQLDLR